MLRNANGQAAAQRLEEQIPADLTKWFRVRVEGKSGQPFEESSLEKARKVLYELIEKGWKELDDKVVECKEFEEKNGGTLDQV